MQVGGAMEYMHLNITRFLSPFFKVRIQVSLYTIFVEQWMALFPREQIFILRLEDYSANRALWLTKIAQFLDIGKQHNSTS
jgi:hypothetical protein